jgi:hypothetical protein
MNITNCLATASGGTVADQAVISTSATTNNSSVYCYNCILDGADYDAAQSGTNVLDVGGSTLLNEATFGTIARAGLILIDRVGLSTGTTVNEFSIDGTLAGNSDDALPTEQAVKTYVDAAGSGPFREIATENIFGPASAGRDALSGSRNFAAGNDAGAALTSASDNVLIGRDTGIVLTSSNANVFVGKDAGEHITSSSDDNVAIGTSALDGMVDGDDNNVAIGNSAMYNLLAGDDNVSIGTNALQGAGAGSNASDNVAIGPGAGSGITTGARNIAIGSTTLNSITTANDNIALGFNALDDIQTGGNNIGIGYTAGFEADVDSDKCIFIGYDAGPNTSATYSEELYIDVLRTDTPLIHGDFSADILTVTGTMAATTVTGANVTSGADPGHTHTGGSLSLRLDQVSNPNTSKTFSMTSNPLKFSFTNPAGADGAFEIETSAVFTGDLFHLHQHTGNPGTTDLFHAEAEDSDVLQFRVRHAGNHATKQLGVWQLDRSGTSDNDETWQSFYFEQDGTVTSQGELEFGRFGITALDVSEDTEDAEFTFDAIVAGSLTEVLAAHSGGLDLPASSKITGENKYISFNLADPNALQSSDDEWSIIVSTPAALTITNIKISLDAAGNELTGDLVYCDAFIGQANPVVINVCDTTSGVLDDSVMATAAVPAGKCIIWDFDGDSPNAAITQASFLITFDYD